MDIESNYSKLIDNFKDQCNNSCSTECSRSTEYNISPPCSTECFICFEHCTIPTPCKCNLYAHPKCIKKFQIASGQEKCSVCLTEYELRTNIKKKFLKYLCCLLAMVFPCS